MESNIQNHGLSSMELNMYDGFIHSLLFIFLYAHETLSYDSDSLWMICK